MHVQGWTSLMMHGNGKLYLTCCPQCNVQSECNILMRKFLHWSPYNTVSIDLEWWWLRLNSLAPVGGWQKFLQIVPWCWCWSLGEPDMCHPLQLSRQVYLRCSWSLGRAPHCKLGICPLACNASCVFWRRLSVLLCPGLCAPLLLCPGPQLELMWRCKSFSLPSHS